MPLHESVAHLKAEMGADNQSWFRSKMWTYSLHSVRKLSNWCGKGSWRFQIYDYSGNDGRLVWSWVLHLGPLWIVRQRYAL